MRSLMLLRIFAIVLGVLLFSSSANAGTMVLDIAPTTHIYLPVIYRMPTEPPDFAIYTGSILRAGFDMGVDTSGRLFDWVTDMDGYMCMAYPSGQNWGVVYITVGRPAPLGQRQAHDFSSYKRLGVDLLGAQGGEVVHIGVKDNRDLDNGSETKVKATLTGSWQTYTFPLSTFATADLANVYIPVEFVFEPSVGPETVCFRNIWYLR